MWRKIACSLKELLEGCAARQAAAGDRQKRLARPTHIAGQHEVERFVVERGALQVLVPNALNHLPRRNVCIDVLTAQRDTGQRKLGGPTCTERPVGGL